MRKKHVKMIQNDLCDWSIITDKGIIIKEDIKVGTKIEAEDYIKRYISSFRDWTYTIIPLGDK